MIHLSMIPNIRMGWANLKKFPIVECPLPAPFLRNACRSTGERCRYRLWAAWIWPSDLTIKSVCLCFPEGYVQRCFEGFVYPICPNLLSGRGLNRELNQSWDSGALEKGPFSLMICILKGWFFHSNWVHDQGVISMACSRQADKDLFLGSSSSAWFNT